MFCSDLPLPQDAAGDNIRLVRVMPNTPCLVGETAAAMCLGGKADDADAEVVRRLFEAVGKIYRWGAARFRLVYLIHLLGQVISTGLD